MRIGITSIGIQIPYTAVKFYDLKGVKYDSDFHIMPIAIHENVVDLSFNAAKKAIENWGGDVKNIGMLAVGTESGVDHARPLSSFLAEKLEMAGNIRSYEVKHACYGGTLAIRQAIEWIASGAATKGQVALVVASDICVYEEHSQAEATQGAASIAFIISRDPKIASIDIKSYSYSAPVKDFYRPIDAQYPIVSPKLTISSYNTALLNCYEQLIEDRGISCIESAKYLSFHVPFTKMVLSAFRHCAKTLDIKDPESVIQTKIEPLFEWNNKTGNCYTASLWISVAKALSISNLNDLILAFSYGSGCGAELLLVKSEGFSKHYWVNDILSQFENCKIISMDEYRLFRSKHSLNKH